MMIERGSVYHFFAPILIVGLTTSPNISAGTGESSYSFLESLTPQARKKPPGQGAGLYSTKTVCQRRVRACGRIVHRSHQELRHRFRRNGRDGFAGAVTWPSRFA